MLDYLEYGQLAGGNMMMCPQNGQYSSGVTVLSLHILLQTRNCVILQHYVQSLKQSFV